MFNCNRVHTFLSTYEANAETQAKMMKYDTKKTYVRILEAVDA